MTDYTDTTAPMQKDIVWHDSECTEDEFTGLLEKPERASIHIFKDSTHLDWYIIVMNDDGYLYDGWWRGSARKSLDEALRHALESTVLYECEATNTRESG